MGRNTSVKVSLQKAARSRHAFVYFDKIAAFIVSQIKLKRQKVRDEWEKKTEKRNTGTSSRFSTFYLSVTNSSAHSTLLIFSLRLIFCPPVARLATLE